MYIYIYVYKYIYIYIRIHHFRFSDATPAINIVIDSVIYLIIITAADAVPMVTLSVLMVLIVFAMVIVANCILYTQCNAHSTRRYAFCIVVLLFNII